MSESIKQLAQKFKQPPEYLIKKMAEAGLPQQSPDDTVSDKDREQLLHYLSGHSTRRSVRGKKRFFALP